MTGVLLDARLPATSEEQAGTAELAAGSLMEVGVLDDASLLPRPPESGGILAGDAS